MMIDISILYKLLSKSSEFCNKFNDECKDLLRLNRNLADVLIEETGNDFSFLYLNCGVGNNLIYLKNIFKKANLYGLERDKNFINMIEECSSKEDHKEDTSINIYEYDSISYSKLPKCFDYIYIDCTKNCVFEKDMENSINFIKNNGTLILEKLVYDSKKDLIEAMLKENIHKYHVVILYDKVLINFLQCKNQIQIKYLNKSKEDNVRPLENVDSNKIAFIFCINNNEKFNIATDYIKRLESCNEFSIDIIAVENASSIAEGYNLAMNSTNAKYKVYLHQDVWILNKKFISDVLRIFIDNESLGLLGCAGTNKIPTNGIWWEGLCYGKVFDSHTGSMSLLSFNNFEGEYKKVQAIDGLILITSKDVEWREDVFKGWHFYDISQCMEFYRKNYDVGVLNQFNPWFVHDCGKVSLDGYEEYNKIFIEEYINNRQVNNENYPLVSILIPAYNEVDYFKIALESALNQTYKNIEIIICDDSTTDNIKNMVNRYIGEYKNIKYYNNGGPLGKRGAVNLQKCFDVCHGEYVNFLMQDDVFSPNKIEIMLQYIINDESVSLVTSYRNVINGEGSMLQDLQVTKPFVQQTSIIDGEKLGQYILENMANVIGEFSTVMFRKKDMKDILLNYKGYTMRCLGDIASWLKLLSKGNAVYIREPLSCFRIHSNQNTFDSMLQIWGAIDWYYLITYSYSSGKFIKDRETFLRTLKLWFRMNMDKIYDYEKYFSIEISDTKEAKEYLYSCYKNGIRQLLNM
ncbi:glycosyltransferase [Clostridium frigidicarnis]|uniref:Glycosyl transferase family 2 n=1 Tax=Clostridium frigidicarnis TaxID=84698 RepID=A0A1I0X9E4_9CLOT|nr:glycosyltransferase [Clostridium frigidicarnis]SFA97046.1 Glycosyl transferase family 2 [Clostridium frigidicarnis]